MLSFVVQYHLVLEYTVSDVALSLSPSPNQLLRPPHAQTKIQTSLMSSLSPVTHVTFSRRCSLPDPTTPPGPQLVMVHEVLGRPVCETEGAFNGGGHANTKFTLSRRSNIRRSDASMPSARSLNICQSASVLYSTGVLSVLWRPYGLEHSLILVI